jgi:osmotically-inducible protein OsmY
VLLAEHPDAVQVVNSESFRQWVSSLPASAAKVVESNDPRDAAWLLGQFKRDFTAAKAAQEAMQAGRKKKLENQVGVGSRAAGGGTESDDAEIARIYEKVRLIGKR